MNQPPSITGLTRPGDSEVVLGRAARGRRDEGNGRARPAPAFEPSGPPARTRASSGGKADSKLGWTAEEENARLAAIVASSPDAIISFAAADGRIMTWNAAATRMFGYAEAEAIGAPVSLLLPDPSPEGPTGVFAGAMNGEPVQLETVRRCKDGRVIDVAISAARMVAPDGRVLGVSGVFRDITGRKRAEAALAASEARRRDLLDTLDLGAFMARDLDGTIQFWSQGCQRLYGWTAAEAVGQTARTLLGTAFPAPLDEIEGALERDGEWTGDLRQRTRNGAEIVVSAHKLARRDAAGRLTAVLECVTDVTALRRAREGRQLLIGELNHRVKNLFAIAIGMATMGARTASSPKAMADALAGRLHALARAHDLIRPAITAEAPSGETTTLRDLLAAVLAPHLPSDGRPRMVGPDISVGAIAAASLALVLHELATNAAKYGALSVSEGSLDVEWRLGPDALELSWTERGGPVITAQPERQGFGSRLMRMSVRDQLGGDIACFWAAEGLRVAVTVPPDRLER